VLRFRFVFPRLVCPVAVLTVSLDCLF
jgi:hypothetical protein